MNSLASSFIPPLNQNTEPFNERCPVDSPQVLRDAVNRNPKDFKLLTDLAAALLKNQKYQESLDEIENALKLSPSYAPAFYLKALAKLFLDQPEEALCAITKAAELANKDQMTEADCKNVTDQKEQVHPQDFLEDINFYDLSSPLQTRTKSASVDPDMFDGALLFIEKAVSEKGHDYLYCDSNKNTAMMQKKAIQAAIKVCDEALKLMSKFSMGRDFASRLYAKKGHCHMANGDYDKAVICFKKAMAHFGKNPEIKMPGRMRAQSENFSNRLPNKGLLVE